MGKEQQIASYLANGLSVAQLIDMGFNKATIYKVKRMIEVSSTPISPPSWVVEWKTHKERYLPGENILLDCSFRNLSGLDMYIYSAGVQPEWMEGSWYNSDMRILLKQGQAEHLTWNISIPESLSLGEYDLYFGLQCQFLSPSSSPVNYLNQIQWSSPGLVAIKHPVWASMFLSHSTQNMSLVRLLDNSLDVYGLSCVIAEDIDEPGRYLADKFQEKIRESTFFMALLTTDAAISEWVHHEILYALQIGNPPILLKEEGVIIPSDIALVEWQSFSQFESIDSIAAKIVIATQEVAEWTRKGMTTQTTMPIGAILVGGILAFIGGLALGSTSTRPRPEGGHS